MGLIEGDEIDSFITMCKNNIMAFDAYKTACAKYKEELPLNVPAYKRIAMVYEKQGEYLKAIEVCASAIKVGAINDGSKGQMVGRLARLVRKYDGQVPQDILEMLDSPAAPSHKTDAQEHPTPNRMREAALSELKDKFIAGEITSEEYHTQLKKLKKDMPNGLI